MARDDPKIMVRVPQEVRDWVEVRAKQNLRSMSAEVMLLLREEMAAEAEIGVNTPAAGNENAAFERGAV